MDCIPEGFFSKEFQQTFTDRVLAVENGKLSDELPTFELGVSVLIHSSWRSPLYKNFKPHFRSVQTNVTKHSNHQVRETVIA